MTNTNATPDYSAWDAAVNALHTANDALRTFDNEVWEPAYAWGQRNGRNLSTALNDEMTRLADLQLAAEQKVCATPAPDMNAAIWKIEYAGNLVDEIEEWSERWWDSAKADLLRLAV